MKIASMQASDQVVGSLPEIFEQVGLRIISTRQTENGLVELVVSGDALPEDAKIFPIQVSVGFTQTFENGYRITKIASIERVDVPQVEGAPC